MSQQPPATGQRAALAMDAVRTYRSGQQPDGRHTADPGTILAAMPGRSGLGKDRLPGSLSEVIPATGDGRLAGG